MIEEVRLFGVYMPAPLAWAVLAALIIWPVSGRLRRLPVARFLWQPGLLDLALFAVLWWGLSLAADHFLPRSLIA
ncbi:MAG: DUF1656 domain-containing protein [Sphingomonas sp.]